MNRKSWINLITVTSILLCHFCYSSHSSSFCVCLSELLHLSQDATREMSDKVCNWSSICFLHFQVRWRETWRHAPTIKVISGFKKTKNWIFLRAKAIKNLIRLLVTNFHTIYRENWNLLASRHAVIKSDLFSPSPAFNFNSIFVCFATCASPFFQDDTAWKLFTRPIRLIWVEHDF